MQSNNKPTTENISHSISLTNRQNITLTGVIEVVSATEAIVILKTTCGPLTITGSSLKIENLNNSTKELSLKGEATEIKYAKGKKSFLKKMFK